MGEEGVFNDRGEKGEGRRDEENTSKPLLRVDSGNTAIYDLTRNQKKNERSTQRREVGSQRGEESSERGKCALCHAVRSAVTRYPLSVHAQQSHNSARCHASLLTQFSILPRNRHSISAKQHSHSEA